MKTDMTFEQRSCNFSLPICAYWNAHGVFDVEKWLIF